MVAAAPENVLAADDGDTFTAAIRINVNAAQLGFMFIKDLLATKIWMDEITVVGTVW
jgi:hypothetical protein